MARQDGIREPAEVEVRCWVHRQKELYLLPHYLGRIQQGVKDAMDATINRYEADLGGIVRQHKNVKLLSVDGTITGEESLIMLSVEADFEVFRPYVGCKLEGVVNKTSANNVSCLVEGTFIVSCPNTEQSENWIGFQTFLGQGITCQVTKVDLNCRIPYIRATILELHKPVKTEREEVKVKIEVKDEEDNIKVKRKKIKKEPLDSPQKKKKRKSNVEDFDNSDFVKMKIKEEKVLSASGSDMEVDQVDTPKKHKKKKKKKDSEKMKKKKRKSNTWEGEEVMFDEDGCPIIV
ncbi:DNA-directed RNA polymerase I subunit RPA43 [Neocloeon triangulifer]|uniref:DNA-directed RNA polymerase I subunit RPA43 n=1 Tax=Neocloeon triangulifer TaxID=2078957 RepID=UPI00286F38D0|nr:DNA-directed RNA polymerase I subunit RPA43 [Neocloeon triangulifer]XP_059474465.1 DNA-directed RNA polymerase I subunit RPA43 [Neocloeon triangulifer]